MRRASQNDPQAQVLFERNHRVNLKHFASCISSVQNSEMSKNIPYLRSTTQKKDEAKSQFSRYPQQVQRDRKKGNDRKTTTEQRAHSNVEGLRPSNGACMAPRIRPRPRTQGDGSRRLHASACGNVGLATAAATCAFVGFPFFFFLLYFLFFIHAVHLHLYSVVIGSNGIYYIGTYKSVSHLHCSEDQDDVVLLRTD